MGRNTSATTPAAAAAGGAAVTAADEATTIDDDGENIDDAPVGGVIEARAAKTRSALNSWRRANVCTDRLGLRHTNSGGGARAFGIRHTKCRTMALRSAS